MKAYVALTKIFGIPCFRVLEKRTANIVSLICEGCCLRILRYDNDIGSVGTSLWPRRRIVLQETRQSWQTNLCYSHAYENGSTLGHELNF